MLNALLYRITGRLPCRIISDGDTPYLERYYVGTLLGWRFYLHRFVGSDPDRGLHDHPWRKAFSVILSGWYWEETRSGTRKVKWFNSLTGDTFHRVVLPHRYQCELAPVGDWIFDEHFEKSKWSDLMPCWTLFFHSVGNVKPWGFLNPMTTFKDCAVFTPYTYSREGSQKYWWLTAPTGNEVRKSQK